MRKCALGFDAAHRPQAVRDVLGEACRDAVALGEVPIRGYDRPMAVWQLG